MVEFQQAHSINAALPFDVRHYESRFEATKYGDSLELLASIANIISLEGPKLEAPKMGYFSTFKVSIPKKTDISYKPKKLGHSKGFTGDMMHDRSRRSEASRVKQLNETKVKSNTEMINCNSEAHYSQGHQELSCAQLYRDALIKNGIHPIKISYKQYKCVICSELFDKEVLVWRHGAKHLTKKPFACNVCSKAFNRMDSLQRHIRHYH